MMPLIQGRAFVFGDRIDTDLLAPGTAMKLPIEELRWHCLEAIDPSFARSVQPGDLLFAGRGFGIGSSREQAAQALKELGVGAVIARSFARIFYRNALNLGLPVIEWPEALEIAPGQLLSLSLAPPFIRNENSGVITNLAPLPEFVLEMLTAGGLMPLLKQRFESANAVRTF